MHCLWPFVVTDSCVLSMPLDERFSYMLRRRVRNVIGDKALVDDSGLRVGVDDELPVLIVACVDLTRTRKVYYLLCALCHR